MKTKIIALMMAVFCLSTCFVGCSHTCDAHVDADRNGICDNCEEEYTAPCEAHKDENDDKKCDLCDADMPAPCEHKDENADKICDACQKAIVNIELKPEIKDPERVPMVVNPIPEGVEIGTYIKVTNTPYNGITTATPIEGNIADIAGTCILLADLKEEITTYTVYDLLTEKAVITLTDAYTGDIVGATKDVIVEFDDEYFTVETVIYDEDDLEASAAMEYYTYDGKRFYEINWEENGDETWSEYQSANRLTNYQDGPYLYFNSKDMIYVMDLESNSIIHSCKKTEYVPRPTFTERNDKYGYLEYENTVFVYDLTKWVECVASYRIPSYLYDVDWVVLENGNVLIYGEEYLSNYAVDFDYIDAYGSKNDLVYMILDVAKNEATSIEFGYKIDQVYSRTELADYYTDQALNIFSVYPIVKDRLADTSMELVVDNTLQVLYNSGSVLPILDDENYLLADNCFLKTTWLDYDTFVREIINEKGEKLAYVPIDAVVYKNYILYDDKVYSLKMEEIIDLGDYLYYVSFENYMILFAYNEETLENECFYYAYGGAKSSIVKLEGIVDMIYHERGFMVATEVEVEGVSQIKISVYNEFNQLIKGIEIENDTRVTGMEIMPIDPETGVYSIGIEIDNTDFKVYLAK